MLWNVIIFYVKNPFITNLKNMKPQGNDFFYDSLKLEFYYGFFVIKKAEMAVLSFRYYRKRTCKLIYNNQKGVNQLSPLFQYVLRHHPG